MGCQSDDGNSLSRHSAMTRSSAIMRKFQRFAEVVTAIGVAASASLAADSDHACYASPATLDSFWRPQQLSDGWRFPRWLNSCRCRSGDTFFCT